jgi:molybdopterin converting factor small subunit
VAIVFLPAACASLSGGAIRFEIDAARVCELVAALEARFPGLGEQLGKSAVAIDGHLHSHGLYAPLQASSQVRFVPWIGAG